MKETKIAEQNIKVFDKEKGETDIDYDTNLTHKQTCQRWLEFLEGLEYDWTKESEKGLINKQLDLKQTIKLYEKAGI